MILTIHFQSKWLFLSDVFQINYTNARRHCQDPQKCAAAPDASFYVVPEDRFGNIDSPHIYESLPHRRQSPSTNGYDDCSDTYRENSKQCAASSWPAVTQLTAATCYISNQDVAFNTSAKRNFVGPHKEPNNYRYPSQLNDGDGWKESKVIANQVQVSLQQRCESVLCRSDSIQEMTFSDHNRKVVTGAIRIVHNRIPRIISEEL